MIPVFAASAIYSSYQGKSSKIIWKHQTNGFVILWKTDQLTIFSLQGGDPIFDEKDMGATPEDRGVDNEENGMARDDYSLLSVVGPLISIQSKTYLLQGNGKGSGSTNRIQTIDLSKPEFDADLRDYFSESELLKGLNADKLIIDALSRRKVPKPSSLDELVEALVDDFDENNLKFNPDLLSQFAFHHITKNLVAVRLVGWCGHNDFTGGFIAQIGLLLPMPETLKTHLLQASKAHGGFLMNNRNKISRGKSARW